MSKNKELDKLALAYHRAATNLRAYTGQLYPPGTRIKCTITGNEYVVKEGSLYADQLYTNMGHIGITNLERKES